MRTSTCDYDFGPGFVRTAPLILDIFLVITLANAMLFKMTRRLCGKLPTLI